MPIRRLADISRMIPRWAAALTALWAGLAATFAMAGSPGDDGPRSAQSAANTGPTSGVAEHDICAQAGLNSPGMAGARCILVLIDHLRVVQLPAGVEAMLVGAPEVADVTLVSPTTAAFSARSVGVTNAIFLDAEGRQIEHYQVVVREPELRRVVLRRGPERAEHYQCAPRCARTLAQSDSEEAFNSLNQRIQNDSALSDTAAAAGDDGEASLSQ